MAVKDIDKGWTKLLNKISGDQAAYDTVAAGVIEAKTDRRNGEVTNAQLATWHEFGTKKDGKDHIPASPFFRPALDESKGAIAQIMTDGAKRLHDPLDPLMPTKFLKMLGQFVSNKIQQYIRDGKALPVGGQLKFNFGGGKGVGSKTRLIDTAQMVRSITYEVRKSADAGSREGSINIDEVK